eukprot:2056715-Pleurochrysis_carterae.AAC.4
MCASIECSAHTRVRYVCVRAPVPQQLARPRPVRVCGHLRASRAAGRAQAVAAAAGARVRRAAAAALGQDGRVGRLRVGALLRPVGDGARALAPRGLAATLRAHRGGALPRRGGAPPAQGRDAARASGRVRDARRRAARRAALAAHARWPGRDELAPRSLPRVRPRLSSTLCRRAQAWPRRPRSSAYS